MSACSTIFSFCKVLTATFSPVGICTPNLTLPKVPSPILLPISQKTYQFCTVPTRTPQQCSSQILISPVKYNSMKIMTESILRQIRMELSNTHQLLLRTLLQCHRNTEVLQKIVKLTTCSLVVVLVHRMTHVVNHHHLELTLHLSNRQLLVHTLLLSSQQNLRHMHTQKYMR